MANRTDPSAFNVHGKNPQFLIEKIVRDKIYNSVYWKTHCFALNAESLVDKAVDLLAAGGSYGGNRKPTEFLCLVLKMLQLQPEKEIVVEFIANESNKYLRVLAAFYMRLTGRPLDIYQYLEPLLQDYRKIRIRNETGKYEISHIDEVIYALLTEPHYFHISLPKIPSRMILEQRNGLPPRESVLQDLDDLEAEENEDIPAQKGEKDENDLQKVDEKKAESALKDHKPRSYKKIFTKAPMKKKVSNGTGAGEEGVKESLSVEETNKLREKLGLKKLV